MMNNALKLVVVGALASVAIAQPAVSQSKIGYVNSAQIMAEAPGRIEAEAELDKEVGAARAELSKLEDSLQVGIAAFQKDIPNLDSATAVSREMTLREMQGRLEKRRDEFRSQLEEKEASLAKPLMELVKNVLDEIRVKNGLAMIFDVASQGQAVVSADSTLDYTQQVITRLKEIGPPKRTSSAIPASAAPAVAGGPKARPAGIAKK